jgi:hypothetical protein
MDDMLIAFGSEVKAVGDGKIEGYLVRFSTPKDPDLQGEFFTKDTDFGIHTRLPLYYQHGFDDRLKTRRIGMGEAHKDDTGLWYSAQIEMRDDYEKMLNEMAAAGKLGYSSGAISHLVEREAVGKAHWLKSWPVGEASLTPTPAEPRNRVYTMKSFLSESEGENEDLSNVKSITLDDINSEGDFEAYLLTRGKEKIARAEATALVAIAKRQFKSLRQREAEDDAKATSSRQTYARLLETQLLTGVPI